MYVPDMQGKRMVYRQSNDTEHGSERSMSIRYIQQRLGCRPFLPRPVMINFSSMWRNLRGHAPRTRKECPGLFSSQFPLVNAGPSALHVMRREQRNWCLLREPHSYVMVTIPYSET